MNWDAIGAIGEVLGAAGVIITLVYLAVQVRQNSHQIERSIEATRVTAEDGVVRSFNEWRALMVADEEVADLYVRGLQNPDALDDADRLRFNYLLGTFGWTAWQLARVQNLTGTLNTEIFCHLMRHPGGRAWFEGQRAYFPADFRGELDDLLQEMQDSGIPDLTPEESSSMLGGVLRSRGGKSVLGESVEQDGKAS